jgi:UDP-N-acetylmuramoylalanine--D-glutamate ligase
MKDYKKKFKGKKITIMGLGILGRGLGYTKFLAECGADLIVTDLKTKEQLTTSIKALSKFKKIKFVLGEHRLEDFKNRDMIVKAGGVPLDSIYIKEAKKNNIPIEMDVSLFIKYASKIKVVGITGTRGKSMTTALIYHILKDNIKNHNVFVGGNMRGVSTLPLLKKVKEGDVLVCELDSWQLQGFEESKISPNISVFTSFMPDHMNYYKGSMEKYFSDKANIYRYQKKGDILVVSKEVKKIIKEKLISNLVIANKDEVKEHKFIVPGEHQRQNLAYAVVVAKQFGISEIKIKKSVKDFKGVEGRLQLLRVYKGIKIYNDNNATTPEAVIAGLKAVFPPTPGVGERNVILICGGSDKKLDLTDLVKNINKYCKFVSLIPGTGTEVLITNYKLLITNEVGKDLKDVIQKAIKNSNKGDAILFSPAFASFGMFNNEYERNDLFVKIIKGLK